MMSAPFPMVVSEVRSIGCVDLDPLDTELPNDLEHFGIYVDVYAGKNG